MINKETIKVTDSHGFNYQVEVRYQPQFGLAFAYYNEQPIADVQYGCLHSPLGDDDREWEAYEERYSEFRDQSIIDLLPKCKTYFDEKK